MNKFKTLVDINQWENLTQWIIFEKNALSIEPLLSLENQNGPFSPTQANKNNNSGGWSWVLVTHFKNIMQVIVWGLKTWNKQPIVKRTD